MPNTRSRTLAFVFSALMAALPFVGLYTAASAEYDEGNVVTVSSAVPAPSGRILDRNGVLLSYDKQMFRVVLVPSLFYSNEAVNSTLERLLSTEKDLADGLSLPVSADGEAAGTAGELERLASALSSEDKAPAALLSRLYEVFGIKSTSPLAYQTACIRYSALMSGGDVFLLSDTPSKELLDLTMSLAQKEPFIRADSSFERRYKKTDGAVTAPHLLTACEEQLSDTLSAKAGLEKQSYRLYAGGIAKRDSSSIEPQAGQDIALSIDSRLQLRAQRLLSDAISSGKCTAGALCVTDCKTGELLCLASAPDFDPGKLSKDYDALSADSAAPLFDRALMGLYRPGSAMKTITALAALDMRLIDADTFLWCGRWFPLGDTTFSCLYYHGYESVQTALRDSCNVFFYKCSQLIGAQKLAKYQSLMGLGSSIDIGVANAAGRVVTPESIKALGIAWSEGLLLQSAIGQSENAVTPLQMAQWAQILANKGTLHPLTIYKSEKKKAVRLLKNDYAFGNIKDGMVLAADNIWGEDSLSSLPHKAAIKTGTPEAGSGYNSTVIGFYPAQKPEIAFSIVLESSEDSKSLIRPLLEEWEGTV